MHVIGTSVQRKDAADKVRGLTKYNIDLTERDILYAKLVTSKYAHARIISINIDKAIKSPGVMAVVTGEVYPGLYGVLLEDRPILAKGKVRYEGEPIAVVIANSEYEAQKAALLVEVKYEPLPVVNSPAEAIKPGAPLVHEDIGQYRKLKPVYPELHTNIANRVKIRKGDISKGWAQSEVVIEAGFNIPQADHVAMEQRNATAEIRADGRVIVSTSSQSPFIVRKMLSRYFCIDEGIIVVRTPVVGGAFGGKAAIQLELIAYLASQSVGGRKVKLVNTREEDMISSPVRIGLDAKIKLGSTKEGIIKAAEITYLVDGGAYSDMAVGITKSIAADCTGPYNIENVWCDSLCMYTNHPYATSFRGFGHMEFTFAIERSMDMLAQKLNIDPLELRLKNAIAPGNTTPTQTDLTNSNIGDLKKCIYELKALLGKADEPQKQIFDDKIKTWGMGCFWKTSSTPTDAVSGAILSYNPDGSINLNIGSVELGAGTKTILAQIVAERLVMDVNKVHVTMEVDTELNPVHWKTVASMTTYMVGNAVLEACEDLIHQLKQIGSIVLRCSPRDLDIAADKIYVKDNPNLFAHIPKVVYGYKYNDGNAIGGQIMGRGTFIMKHLSTMNAETGKGKPGPEWTVGVQAVEIEFDKLKYTYNILKAITVIDVGRLVNPKTAEGVIMGGMCMGLGSASMEGFIYDKEGLIQNHQLRTYKIINIEKAPVYQIKFIETQQIDAPYGARGIGEHGDLAMPASLGNAISKALGTDINSLPLTPENIWRARKEGSCDSV